MRSLNAAQAHKHLVAILQFAVCDALLESRERFFDLGHKAAPDGFLLLLPPHRTAEDVSLLTARNLDLLDLHVWANLFEIIFQQLLLELPELAACCAHQILSATLADGHQVLFTHHPAIEDPYPPSFPVLAPPGSQ